MSSPPAWIVLAEDNRPDVFLIQEALAQEGLPYRMDTIEDGDEVLNFIARLEADGGAPRPDLLVLDLNMPKRSGTEILSRLRSSSRCGHIPVMVISSSDAPHDRELAKRLGASLYFPKPLTFAEFMKIGGHIRSLLDRTA